MQKPPPQPASANAGTTQAWYEWGGNLQHNKRANNQWTGAARAPCKGVDLKPECFQAARTGAFCFDTRMNSRIPAWMVGPGPQISEALRHQSV